MGKLLLCAIVVMSGFTMLFIFYKVWRNGYIKIVEECRTILLIEAILAGLFIPFGLGMAAHFCWGF